MIVMICRYDMYKHDAVSNNPFAPVFIQLLSPSDTYDPGEQLRSVKHNV